MATGVHHINNPAAGDRNPVYTFRVIWPTGMEFIHSAFLLPAPEDGYINVRNMSST